jgi:DNA-binding winged helix-turn-helix (wHTH) protein
MKTRSSKIYEFGLYQLDLAERRLSRRGQEVALRPKLFDLLTYFVERSGLLIKKDELLDSVWASADVEESAVTVSVSELRRALGDERYIETVGRHGYRFVAALKTAPVGVTAPREERESFEPPGGALPLSSRFYIARDTDEEFKAAIARCDSVVLVKGARQIGKTSLLARGLQEARAAGAAIVLTDFQHLMSTAFESPEKLVLMLSEMIADQLDLQVSPHEAWNGYLSPSTNFERYLRREALGKIESPLVWGLDEVDRLFSLDYASEIFGLFRSWHNLRALDPQGPWGRMTLAMAYATEAHLFITDLNQSPFNVGTNLTLKDFTSEQVGELNRRYGEPLRNESEAIRFHGLIGGHPYLTQRGLYEMVRRKITLAEVEAEADRDEGLFGDHLRRTLAALERDGAMREALCGLLHGRTVLTAASFYRLRAAGVIVGDSPEQAAPRCELYARYLKGRLL